MVLATLLFWVPLRSAFLHALRMEGDKGYENVAGRMADLAAQQPGYLGVESVRGADGLGITVSFGEIRDV